MADENSHVSEKEDSVDTDSSGTDQSLLIGALLAIFLRLLGIVVYIPRHPGDGYAFIGRFRALALIRVLQAMAMVIMGGDPDRILVHATIEPNGRILPSFFVVRQIVEYNHQEDGRVPDGSSDYLVLSRFYHKYQGYSIDDDGLPRVQCEQDPVPDVVKSSFSTLLQQVEGVCPIQCIAEVFEEVIPGYLGVGDARSSLTHECSEACRLDNLFSGDLLWRVMHAVSVALSTGPPEGPGGLVTIKDPPFGEVCSDGRLSLGPDRTAMAVSRWEMFPLLVSGRVGTLDPIYVVPTFQEGLSFFDGDDGGECGIRPDLEVGGATTYFEVFQSGPSLGVTCFNDRQDRAKQCASVKEGVPPWASFCFEQSVFSCAFKPLGGDPRPAVVLPSDMSSSSSVLSGF